MGYYKAGTEKTIIFKTRESDARNTMTENEEQCRSAETFFGNMHAHTV